MAAEAMAVVVEDFAVAAALSAAHTPEDILPAATVAVTAAAEGWVGTRAGVMAGLEVWVPAAVLAARMACQDDPLSEDPHLGDPHLAGAGASPARETFTPRLRTASSILLGARELQGSAAVLPLLEADGTAVFMVAAFILVSAGEDAGVAVGALALASAGESGIRFGIGPRTGIARGGVTTIRIFTRMLTSGS